MRPSRPPLLQTLLFGALTVFAWQRRPLPAPAAPAGEVASPGGCLEDLDELVARPAWRFTITDGGSSCFGDHVDRSFTVWSTGRVDWEEDGVVRAITLRPEELDMLRGLDRFDCIRKREAGHGEPHYRVAFAGDPAEGTTISGSSSMGLSLHALFEEAMTRTAGERLTRMGEVRLELAARSSEASDRWSKRAAIYRVEVDRFQMTIRRRGRVIAESFVSDRELMRVVEFLDADRGHPPEPADTIAMGTLHIGNRSVSLRLGDFSYEPLLEALARPFSDAVWGAEHPED